MLSLCLLNLMKTSLKNMYDIEPLVVDHLLLGAKMHASVVAAKSAHLFEGVARAVKGIVPALHNAGDSAMA